MYRKVIVFILFISSIYSLECKEYDHKKLVAVIGMHRSGTSLVSKGLQALGVCFGDNLLPGASDNPLGFYEDIDIGSFNETLLYLFGLSCDSIKNYPKDIYSEESLIQYGVDLIKAKTSKGELFGFKDPRTARNMSLWKEIFLRLPDTKVQIVIIFRNPISVAQSLYNRNRIDPIRSYYMWLQYYVSALLAARDFEVHFIDYESLIKNPYLEIKRLGESLKLQLNRDIESQLESFAKNYVDLSMQHYQATMVDRDLYGAIPYGVNFIYNSFLEMGANRLSKKEFFNLAYKVNQRLQEMDPLLTMIDKIEGIGETKKYRLFELVDELVDLK